MALYNIAYNRRNVAGRCGLIRSLSWGAGCITLVRVESARFVMRPSVWLLFHEDDQEASAATTTNKVVQSVEREGL